MRAARYGLYATYWIAQFLRYLFLWYISFASPIFGAFLTYISNIHCRPCHWSVRLDLQTRSAQNSHLPQSASYTNPLSSDHSSLSIHFVQIGLSSDISSKPEEQSSEANAPVRQLFPTPPEIFAHKPPSLLEVCWVSYQHPEPRCDTLFCTSWLVAPKIELKSWSTNLCDILQGCQGYLSLVLIESAPKYQFPCGLVLCDNFSNLWEHLDAGLRPGA